MVTAVMAIDACSAGQGNALPRRLALAKVVMCVRLWLNENIDGNEESKP
jgi:hypothetical protein